MESIVHSTNSGPTKTRFLVLAWLCAAAALAYVSRHAIAVAESTVRGDLGLTKDQSGWLMSAFFISYAICSIPAAQFGQRRGSRRAMSLFAIIWSAATVGTALMAGFAGFVAARIVQGIAQAGLFPTSTVTVAKWFPATGRAFALGALGSFMSVGGALCAWLTGVLLAVLAPHVAAGWNWRITFLIFAVPGFVWAVAFWFWFRDDPEEHPAVNQAELAVIRGESAVRSAPESAKAGGAPDREARSLGTPWLAIFSSPAMWWLCGQQALRAAGYMFFTSWFATYLQETRGVSIAHSGFLNTLPLVAVVVAGLVGGALSDWLLQKTARRDIARRWMSALCLLVCAALIFLSRAMDDALSAVLIISAGSFFAALAAPCAYAMTIDMGGPHVAAVNATMNMMGNVGAWAFPIVVPRLLARFGNWDSVLIVFGALYILGALFWLLLKPEGTILDQSLCGKSPHQSHASTLP